MDLLITANVNIYQTKKKYFNNNENFSERKVMKQSGTPLPFLREPPFQLREEETMGQWLLQVSQT